MRPGSWLNVSQIEGPRPSSSTAPSIWKEAVAAPQTKPSGKRSRAAAVDGAEATVPAELTRPSLGDRPGETSGRMAGRVPADVRPLSPRFDQSTRTPAPVCPTRLPARPPQD